MPSLRHARTLIVAFAAVALSFVLSTTYTQWRANGIDRSAAEIATEVAPRIVHLAAARNHLYQLQQALRALVSDPGGPSLHAQEVIAAQREMDREIDLYQAAGRQRDGELDGALHEIDRTIQQTLADEVQGDVDRSARTFERRVRPALERGRDRMIHLLELHGRQAFDLGVRIERGRRREVAVAFALDGISLGLAALVLALSIWAMRRYTHLLEAHQALLQRRADEMESFAGRVAHDILSPLNGVAFFAHLVKPRVEGDAKLSRALERAQGSLAQVKRIVHDLLEFARSGAVAPKNVRTAVRSALHRLEPELCREAEEAGVVLSFTSEELEVACAEGVFTSLVQNLVRNAIKYIGQGARREVHVRAKAQGDACRIEVEDTGPGLPPGKEQAVFEPFVRVHGEDHPGIGLGLATVKRLTEAHHGRVGVSSSPGGCLFWLELPRPEGAHVPQTLH